MIKLSISDLQEAAKNRLPGYLNAVLGQGKIEGDVLHLTRSAYDTLRAKYRSTAPPDTSAISLVRYEICQTCPNTADASFACRLYKGCCFARWRAQPTSQCPATPPNWPAT
jgi:hypothetical protein